MNGEVVTDAVADYVMASKSSLSLALEVEQALDTVRYRLVTTVLDEMQAVLYRPGWVVNRVPVTDLMKRYAWISTGKETWNSNGDKCLVGATLAADNSNWKNVYMGVSCPAGVLSREDVERMKLLIGEKLGDTFGGYQPKSHEQYGAPAWVWLESEYSHWLEKEFLLRVNEESERAKVVQDLSNRMSRIAETVGPILDEKCAPRKNA